MTFTPLPTELQEVGGDFPWRRKGLQLMVLAKASILLGSMRRSSGSPQNGPGPLFLDTILGLSLLIGSGQAVQLSQGVHPTRPSCPASQPRWSDMALMGRLPGQAGFSFPLTPHLSWVLLCVSKLGIQASWAESSSWGPEHSNFGHL